MKTFCLSDQYPRITKIRIDCWKDGSLYITNSTYGISNHHVGPTKDSRAYQANGVMQWLFGYLKPGESKEFEIIEHAPMEKLGNSQD
jgi:hypothetical protein